MLGFEIPVYNSRLQAFRTREGERRQTESDEILREIFVVLHSGSEITSPGSSLQPVRLQLVTCSDHPPGHVHVLDMDMDMDMHMHMHRTCDRARLQL